MGAVSDLVRREPVLIASALLALASFALVPPSPAVMDHVDLEVVCILFCFMVSVAGMAGCGVFGRIAHRMVMATGGVGTLCTVLVLLPFLCSMFVTNDVALITFVPLTMTVLRLTGLDRLTVPVLVLQTVGANLGSMLTPFGNPQNLFIHSRYSVGGADFVMEMLPLVVAGGVVLFLATAMLGRGGIEPRMEGTGEVSDVRFMWASAGMFALCIATVLGAVPLWILLVAVLAVTLLMSPRTLLRVDYGLLLTFLFLFVFTGNVSEVGQVSSALGGLMSWDPVVTSVVASQFISNVPAAIMLSGFTEDWAGLLAGVNIGGFGTPIASMASLITLRFYMASDGHDTRGYMVWFTAANVVMLLVLLPVSYLVR
ncbi:MAG: hypothetical protein IJ026_06590 [Candidatus Methanomethylophilaceae archaeon]|nr:hypothetical protein [Candidatus Methanomethylophilaceae archaeon]